MSSVEAWLRVSWSCRCCGAGILKASLSKQAATECSREFRLSFQTVTRHSPRKPSFSAEVYISAAVDAKEARSAYRLALSAAPHTLAERRATITCGSYIREKSRLNMAR